MTRFLKPGRNNRGFSLIELVITIVVLGIAISALSRSLFTNIGRNADPLWQSKATQLAQAYLDEILAMRYADASPLGGGSVGACSIDGNEADETSRSLYDDVDDYHGLNESGDFLDTATSSDYSQYTINIQVRCRDHNNAASINSKWILLTITAPGNNALRFSAFRGDF